MINNFILRLIGEKHQSKCSGFFQCVRQQKNGNYFMDLNLLEYI